MATIGMSQKGRSAPCGTVGMTRSSLVVIEAQHDTEGMLKMLKKLDLSGKNVLISLDKPPDAEEHFWNTPKYCPIFFESEFTQQSFIFILFFWGCRKLANNLMPVSKRREKTTAASPLHAGLGMARGAHHVCNGPKEPLIPGIMPGASHLAGEMAGNLGVFGPLGWCFWVT